jgi:hypothetical protein
MNDGHQDAVGPFATWPGLKKNEAVPPAAAEPSAAISPVVPREFDFILESKLVTETPPATSDGSSADGLAGSRYEHGLWRAGWTDGRLGETPEPQLQLVASQAAFTRADRLAAAQRNLADAQAEQRHKRVLVEQRKNEWSAVDAEHARISHEKRTNGVAYSRGLAFLYAFFGVMIFVADLPLSFNVAPTLGIDLKRDGFTATNIDELFANFGRLWEPFAVAIGIAALTIAFKMLIDKLHVPYGFTTWWSKLLSAVLFAGTFGCLVWSFLRIGDARAAYLSGRVTNDQDLFILLALTFPLVAGYCFSMARIAWQNFRQRQEVELERKTAWTRFIEENHAAEKAGADVQSAQEVVRAVTADRSEAEFLRNLYLHGYQRGRCVPETIDQQSSLYDRCESLLHHWLAQLEQTTHEAAERKA